MTTRRPDPRHGPAGGRSTSRPPKPPRPRPAPVTTGPVVDRLRRDLAARRPGSPEAAAVLDRFWDDTAARTPIIEDAPDGALDITFLWQDDTADEVLLFVNRLTDERDLPASLMRRVPGTDVWHLSYRMPPDWRASYSVVPRLPGQPWPWDDHGQQQGQVAIRHGLDRGRADPRNPHGNRNRSGVRQSVVAGPAAPRQDWLAPRPGTPRGTVHRHEGPDARTVWVYGPPAVVGPGPHPVVVVLDGEVWTGPQDLATTVDNLLADRLVRPALLVMVDSGGRDRRWAEMGDGPGTGDWVVTRLLPWVRDRWVVRPGPQDVVVAGQSLGGLTALRTVLTHPDAVGAALSQSASLWHTDLTEELARATGGSGTTGIRAYVEVGTQEWVLHGPNRRFAERLAATGATVRFVEYDGGHDYACWRGGIADGLRELLPPEVPAARDVEPPPGDWYP